MKQWIKGSLILVWSIISVAANPDSQGVLSASSKIPAPPGGRVISFQKMTTEKPLSMIQFLLRAQNTLVRLPNQAILPAVVAYSIPLMWDRLEEVYEKNPWFREVVWSEAMKKVAVMELKEMKKNIPRGKPVGGYTSDYLGQLEAVEIANAVSLPEGNLLEVGGSTGFLMAEFVKRKEQKGISENVEHVVFDKHESALSFGRRLRREDGIHSIRFVNGNVTKIQYPNGHFRCILDKQLIETARIYQKPYDKEAMIFHFFSEANRLLPVGGLYVAIYWPSEGKSLQNVPLAFNFELVEQKEVKGLKTLDTYTISIFRKRENAQTRFNPAEQQGIAISTRRHGIQYTLVHNKGTVAVIESRLNKLQRVVLWLGRKIRQFSARLHRPNNVSRVLAAAL